MSIVTVNIPDMKKGQTKLFKIPNLRHKNLIIEKFRILSTHHNWEIKLHNKGNLISSYSLPLLQYYQNCITLDDSCSDLLLSLKATENNSVTQLSIVYHTSIGVPLYHSIFHMSSDDDRDNLMDNIIKQCKSIISTQIVITFPNTINISKIIFRDPYTIDNEFNNFEITLTVSDDGMFRLNLSIVEIDRLSRMQMLCFDTNEKEYTPHSCGIIILGYLI